MHWGVDSAVAFLLIAFLGWIIGLHIGMIIAIALVLGALAVPFTRDLEARMLEETFESEDDERGGAD